MGRARRSAPGGADFRAFVTAARLRPATRGCGVCALPPALLAQVNAALAAKEWGPTALAKWLEAPAAQHGGGLAPGRVSVAMLEHHRKYRHHGTRP